MDDKIKTEIAQYYLGGQGPAVTRHAVSYSKKSPHIQQEIDEYIYWLALKFKDRENDKKNKTFK